MSKPVRKIPKLEIGKILMVNEVHAFEAYNAFDDIPRVQFSKESIEKEKGRSSILGIGDSRSTMFQQRYNMILQHLFRDSKFVDTARGKRGADFPVISFGKQANDAASKSIGVNSQSLFLIHSECSEDSPGWRFELTPVESLPGSMGTKVVFGMLTKGENAAMFVEDIHQSVPLKMDSVEATSDFITENMFVLLKGEMIDEIFVVAQMTLPPVPKRSLCESSLNLFGGSVDLTEEVIIDHIGEVSEDTTVAVVSHVLLDQPSTIEKLHLLFSGFEQCEAIPSVYVLVGPFASRQFNAYNGDCLRSYQRAFDSLIQVLARHPQTMEQAKIIIVPGEGDPGCSVHPRIPLGTTLTRGIATRFSNVVLATNPCRMRIHNKQMTFGATACVAGLRRNRLVVEKDTRTGTEEELTMRCILSQMHLCPGPIRENNIAGEFDMALRVYPPPHALFLADPGMEEYQQSYNNENIVVSLPKFATPAGATGDFHLYCPSSNESTLSSV